MYGASRECHEHEDVDGGVGVVSDDDEHHADTESYDNSHQIPVAPLGYLVPINTLYFVESLSQLNPYLCEGYSHCINASPKPGKVVWPRK